MNNIPARDNFAESLELPQDAWSKLLKLAQLIEFNEGRGELVVRNGKARIVLREDGTIRIEGTCVVQKATQNIALEAAYIELN
ncbi:hypothetical protein [Phyllobacterium sp. P30BS-XVII]|uniref:hypothetical protein n=1 Tax=Phyllobacterium sp. P30BS-XVII TaxID=2587046 RepID=UPI0013AEAE82|nr:hypothetical protein [Phyllobacterium sp. P30BS-XVII]MBA8902420.1 hypothetical protein [Phyllobacterium sp. P30BS-XVII]